MSQAVTTTESEAASAAPIENLAALIDGGADQAKLAAYLDGLPAEERIRDAQSLGKKQLAALYERCEGSVLTLEDMVPANAPVGEQVIFAGRNDLLMFRRFEKRFFRTLSLHSIYVFGLNHHEETGFAWYIRRNCRCQNPEASSDTQTG